MNDRKKTEELYNPHEEEPLSEPVVDRNGQTFDHQHQPSGWHLARDVIDTLNTPDTTGEDLEMMLPYMRSYLTRIEHTLRVLAKRTLSRALSGNDNAGDQETARNAGLGDTPDQWAKLLSELKEAKTGPLGIQP